MQIKIFNIPVCNSSDMETEANRFLRSHRVLKLEHAFCLESIYLLSSLVV